jgi:hypothetical protein
MIAAHQKIAVGFNKDLREQTGKVYGTIFKQLNLPADVQQKVIDILMQAQQRLEQQAFEAAQSGSFPAPPSPQEIQMQQAQQDNQLRSVLGDAGFAQFNQYRTTIPDRTIIDQMNQQGANLNDNQSQQLLQILTDARAQIQNSVIGEASRLYAEAAQRQGRKVNLVHRLAYNGAVAAGPAAADFSRRERSAAGGNVSAGRRVGVWAFAKSYQLRGDFLVNIAMSKSSFIPQTPLRRHAVTPIRRHASPAGGPF